MGDRDQFGTRPQKFLKLVEEKIAIVVDRRPFDDNAVAFPEEMPGHDVGVVLHDREHDLIAFTEVRLAPGRGDEVDRFGDVAGEDDFLIAPGVDELRHFRARALVGLRRRVGEVVEAAMNIGVFAGVGLHEALKYRLGLLRRRGVVEIDQRLAVNLQGERRKILADTCDIVGPV